jgi:hypothetical protein
MKNASGFLQLQSSFACYVEKSYKKLLVFMNVLIFIKLSSMAFYIAACMILASAVAVVMLCRKKMLYRKKIEKNAKMLLELPDVYQPYGPEGKLRIVIEYNMQLGPVAAHFDNGDKWGFCNVRHSGFATRWTLFVEDYMNFGINNVTAIATHVCFDTMRLTLSSENVILREMLIGKAFIAGV